MDVTAEIGFLAEVAARTAIVLAALVVGGRIGGKRKIGERNVLDILLVLMVANAVQNAMTSGNGQLTVALVAAGALIGLTWLISALTSRAPWLERRLMGSPTVICQRGRLLWPNLRREGIGEAEIMAELRKQGLDDANRVELAVLEMDGSISIVPRQEPGEPGEQDEHAD